MSSATWNSNSREVWLIPCPSETLARYSFRCVRKSHGVHAILRHSPAWIQVGRVLVDTSLWCAGSVLGSSCTSRNSNDE